MGVVCPACGETSQDPEFCDYCNSDLSGPPPPPLFPGRCPVTAAGVVLTSEQQAVLSRPEASLRLQVDDQWWRVHWIKREAWPLWSARVRQRLAKNGLRCLPPVRLVETADGVWLLAETSNALFHPWANPLPDPLEECERLHHHLVRLAEALEELHAHGLVWLIFDPRQLDEGPHGQIRFTNLDLELFPVGDCPESLPLRTQFAAPEIVRYHPQNINSRMDVFHLAIFAYYWVAGLLPTGFVGEGLEAFRYQLPKLRIFAPRLPNGIASVLSQGLAVDPTLRPATPKAFVGALQGALERFRARCNFPGTIRWDIGADTRTGRTKSALGRDNEDCVLVRSFVNPERALVAVADGITTCDVGSGALASLITTIVLENTFDNATTQATFTADIVKACRHCAQTLLAWAVEKGYLPQLEQSADLMGTTLVAGWLEGNAVCLANLGDSRAYLIDNDGAEQLTVDGDLASGMLADGLPPENLADVGPIGKALRECIGGCTMNAEGVVGIHEEGCRPTVTYWPLVPGDIIVLCSDGLVDEEVFMEPTTLSKLVLANRHLPAQELARLLADAADQIHRLPSPLEPEGFGDNISCIVVKIDRHS